MHRGSQFIPCSQRSFSVNLRESGTGTKASDKEPVMWAASVDPTHSQPVLNTFFQNIIGNFALLSNHCSFCRPETVEQLVRGGFLNWLTCQTCTSCESPGIAWECCWHSSMAVLDDAGSDTAELPVLLQREQHALTSKHLPVGTRLVQQVRGLAQTNRLAAQGPSHTLAPFDKRRSGGTSKQRRICWLREVAVFFAFAVARFTQQSTCKA